MENFKGGQYTKKPLEINGYFGLKKNKNSK